VSKTERNKPAAGREDEPDEAFRYPTSQSIGFLVRMANRAFQRALEERIVPHGVTRGQWYFLRVLWEEDGLTQRELSARVGMMEPTTVVALNSLEQARLIRRVRSRTDRRKVHVVLTPKGRRLRDTMLPLAREVNAEAARGIADNDIETLKRTLERLTENLDRQRRKTTPPDR